MSNLLIYQHVRDDAYHFAAARQHRIGDDAHQTDGRATVDDSDTARSQFLGKFDSGLPILRQGALVGATKDTNALHV